MSFRLRCVAVVFLATGAAQMACAQQAKERDRDVLYDEALVPHYDLPPLLVGSDGTPVTTPDDWFNRRRPEILALFRNLLYGVVPQPATPLETSYEVVKVDDAFLDGKATRKDVRIAIKNTRGSVEMHVLVFTPNGATEPVPAFMMHSFDNTRSMAFREHRKLEGHLANGWPLGAFLSRGFGFVVVYQQDLVGHNEVEFSGGIHRLFYPDGQSFPKANEWGVLSTVAWGGMRAMDYLAVDDGVDQTRVAVMGHSKMGKAALWTAAQDQRFAMAVSAQSGAGGAALWRRKSGETLEKMVTRFPYWLCRNAWKFVGREDDLPIDQHMMLALIAPRPLYVYSSTGDTWADPRGEYLSAHHASAVYGLLGARGLDNPASPPVGTAVLDATVGYHVREGGHTIAPYDWERILDFGARHLTKP